MKLIIKIIVFFIFVFFLQVIFFEPTSSFPLYPADKTDTILKDKPDIILFGDSVIKVADLKDTDKRPVDLMLQEKIPNLNLKSIDYLAYNPDIYLEYIKYIINSKYKLKAVVVAINLRSFSPVWDQKPGYQFEQEKLTLRFKNTPIFPYLKFLININVFNLIPITDVQYDNTPVYSRDKKIGLIKDFENESYETYTEEHQKNKILLYYTYPLSTSHHKLKALEEIADLLQKNNIKATFYITPVDHETIEKYAGSDAKDQMSKNINLIKNSLSKYPIVFLDLSFKVSAKNFTWKEAKYVNEHLGEFGRQYLAHELATSVLELLQKY